MNSNRAMVFHRSVLGTLLPLAFAWAPAFAVTEIHGNSGTAVVSVGDLDLATASGRTQAHDRVEITARRLCGKLGDPADWSRHEHYLACVDEAVASAMQKLGQGSADLKLPQS